MGNIALRGKNYKVWYWETPRSIASQITNFSNLWIIAKENNWSLSNFSSFYHLDKHTPTHRWRVQPDWLAAVSARVGKYKYISKERKGGKWIHKDKRKSGKEKQVFMLARLFLQALQFYVCKYGCVCYVRWYRMESVHTLLCIPASRFWVSESVFAGKC